VTSVHLEEENPAFDACARQASRLCSGFSSNDLLVCTRKAIVEWYHLQLHLCMIPSLKHKRYTCFDMDPETLRLPSFLSTRLGIDAAERTDIYT
jgi:hypothetical protein